MARKCFMCGRELAGTGILCEKCDKPRKKSSEAANAAATGISASPPADPPQKTPPAARASSAAEARAAVEPAQRKPEPTPPPARSVSSSAQELDPFPKAPVVPFPVESASPAITSVVNLLVAAGVASVLVGPDRSVKFVSDEARRLFDAPMSDLSNLKFIEAKAGIRVGDMSVSSSAGIRVGGRNILYTLVPMSGGASGAVLVFRHADPLNESHASFVTYVRETVLGPLHSMAESLGAAARSRQDGFLSDAAAGLEQILSSIELAPEIEEPLSGVRPVPTVTAVVQRVADRFRAYADMKGIELVIDVQDLEERFADHEQLAESLAILMDNAVHYVPPGGQVVIGVRWMEHKGKPLLLFFVMDNGPLVPEELRSVIFEPSYVWNPSGPDRAGRGLFKTREFAVSHAGSVWVESKPGKGCRFFLRVRPDGVN